MSAIPNLFIFTNRQEIPPFLVSTTGTSDFGIYRRGEVSFGMVDVFQRIFATGDLNTGQWSASPLFNKLNENYPNDLSIINSRGLPTTGDVFEVKLSGISNPNSLYNHTLAYRYGGSGAGATGLTIFVSLLQGATLIAQNAHSGINSGDLNYGFLYLTTGQAFTITDYSDLRVRINASGF